MNVLRGVAERLAQILDRLPGNLGFVVGTTFVGVHRQYELWKTVYTTQPRRSGLSPDQTFDQLGYAVLLGRDRAEG